VVLEPAALREALCACAQAMLAAYAATDATRGSRAGTRPARG